MYLIGSFFVSCNQSSFYKPLIKSTLTFFFFFILVAPSIVSLGPSKYVSANVHNKTTLTCLAEGNPAPRYQWLQKLPTHEVLVRGYSQHLQIENVTYDHQGEFVCKAVNVINGEQRSVQSDPIIVEVTGAPQVTQFAAIKEVIVGNGKP